MGGSKWMKAKMALGLKLNSCLYVPKTVEDSAAVAAGRRFSDAVALSPTAPRDSEHQVKMPTTPVPSSSGLLLPKQSSKSSKMICAICLASMKPGQGHAIFTAECSHSFHFHCISSNVKHGKKNCPVCRAKWKEIPFQGPNNDKSPEGQRVNNLTSVQDDSSWMRSVRRVPSPRGDVNRPISTILRGPEPAIFDDDDEVSTDQSSIVPNSSSSGNVDDDDSTKKIEVKTYPEVSAVSKLKPHKNFSILVHLKAPTRSQHSEINGSDSSSVSSTSRAPVDLVTVLDVSGSMAGTKLALLKQAMGFVIQALGPADRISVVAFSSTARRILPLRRMTQAGKDSALQAVNSLSSNGGTNIAEGLRKGAKVLMDRKGKNPVSSVILLSDGQDTYTTTSPTGGNTRLGHQPLLPVSMHRNNTSGHHIPVHAFGFGTDHDAVSMHSISETSGGTFSFIETESVIQDAFAQCIGGLLSVVVQELKVEVECTDPLLQLTSIRTGNYVNVLSDDKRKCSIEVGDLYAEEERDFLVTTDIPICQSIDETPLVKVRCVYKNPVSKNLVTLDPASDVKIGRPIETGPVEVSMEVDRQRNRLRSAEVMAEARALAERGDLASAVSLVENFRKQLSESVSLKAGDKLCLSLNAELREMQERMANRQVYETSGRAYMLSGLSSHSWQRATARGDSTDITGLVQAYQTPSMVDMVTFSQTTILGPPGRPAIRPSISVPLASSPPMPISVPVRRR